MQDWTVHEVEHSLFKKHAARDSDVKGGDGLPSVIFNSDSHAGGAPGPGSYDMQAFASMYRKSGAVTWPSAAFVRGMTDRFGQLSKSRAGSLEPPGPGTYPERRIAFEGKEGIVSSFVSTVRSGARFRAGC